jgi:hypothetical protein
LSVLKLSPCVSQSAEKIVEHNIHSYKKGPRGQSDPKSFGEADVKHSKKSEAKVLLN